jgi:hypothetical protein
MFIIVVVVDYFIFSLNNGKLKFLMKRQIKHLLHLIHNCFFAHIIEEFMNVIHTFFLENNEKISI